MAVSVLNVFKACLHQRHYEVMALKCLDETVEKSMDSSPKYTGGHKSLV